ncbi:hypothetical protein ACG9X2_10765 [Acinetobacter bereziniae]|uniref:hypothetical protein n=1 Tax=Acinetobacter bereziniae TaxID=106648 RepID=UPI003AF899F8
MNTDFETIMAKTEVNRDEITRLHNLRLEKYKNKSFIEKYALYMGMAQILELQMKQILYRKFDFSTEKKLKKLETMTFGQSVKQLADKGVRSDIINLLNISRDNRNNMAHSFLVDTIISSSLGFNMESIEVRQLDKYIIELEDVSLFWEWCVNHDALLIEEN